MLRPIVASPIAGPGRELVLAWDPEAGTFAGRDAQLVELELARGGAWWRGVNAYHPIDDARRDPAHLAALLLRAGYQPPADLAAALGDPIVLPDDTPDGAVE